MEVQLVDHMGTDRSVLRAMLVSTGKEGGEGPLSAQDKGRLNFLMREHHASPFEHCVVTFYVKCSLAVRSEWHRHRTQSFSEFSYRYATPADGLEFHLPELEDMRKQVGKPGAYSFEVMPAREAEWIRTGMALAYERLGEIYQALLDTGVAREVARGILPVNTLTRFYATANLRNWLNFLVLRNAEPAMKEIRVLAADVEAIIADLYPATYEAWTANGRPQL